MRVALPAVLAVLTAGLTVVPAGGASAATASTPPLVACTEPAGKRVLGPAERVARFSATCAITTATATATTQALRIDLRALRALPTTTTAWASLRSIADGDLGAPNLADQDNRNAGRTFAAALVYARTGNPLYRAKVAAELQGVPTSPLGTARVLSVARQLAGYVTAADLVGYRDPAFVSFVGSLRTRHIGNHGRWQTLSQTSADTSSNWGAWALASRIAASLYVGDSADVATSARILRGFLGDRSAYAGFRPTADYDAGFACPAAGGWVPINPVGCGSLDGALVEDISRSAGVAPAIDNVGLTYSWEALGGALLSATMLSRTGYPQVYDWSDRALLRAAMFLHRNGGYPPAHSTNQYIPWMINRAYGVALGPLKPAGLGRQYGFTDWFTA